jgi:hypothetical protein
MKNRKLISPKARKIVVLGTDSPLTISRYEVYEFLSKEPETAAEESSREGIPGLSSSSTDVLPLRKQAAHVSTARTENILAVYEAEFRLDLMVGFMGKDVLTNHGALLKVHDRYLTIMSVINRF